MRMSHSVKELIAVPKDDPPVSRRRIVAAGYFSEPTSVP